MKYFIFLLLFPALCLSEHTHIDKLSKVKGGYRNCYAYSFSFNKGIIDTLSKDLICVYHYDEKGEQTETILKEDIGKSKNNSLSYSDVIDEEIKYDSLGNEIESVFYSGDSIWCKRVSTYRYDENGGLIETDHFNTYSSGRNHFIIKYDGKGNITEQRGIDCDTLEFTNSYVYNEKGKLLKILHKVPGHKDQVIHTNKYNKQDLLIESISYFWGGPIERKDIYKYDKNGFKIKKVSYVYEGCDIGIETEYFEKNSNRLKETQYKSLEGEYYGKSLKTYNKIGNLTEEKYFDSSSHIFNVEKYDDYGNLIEEINYENNKPISKTEYKYTK